MPVSSRPNDIHHEILVPTVNSRRDRSGPQQARSDGQRFRSPLETRYVKRGKECTDLGGINRPWSENVFEGELEIVGIKVLWGFDQLVQQRFERKLGVRFWVLVAQLYRHRERNRN